MIIRPLAKLKKEVKIADTGNEIESQGKTFSPITITLGKDFESLDEPDGVLIGRTFA